jgi:hypothetical protein
MDNFDNKYMKKWLCVAGYDRRFKKMYQEMTLTGIFIFSQVLRHSTVAAPVPGQNYYDSVVYPTM